MPKAILIAAYYLAFAFLFAGFLLHESHEPAMLQYSGSYFVFLVALSSGFIVPPVMWLALRKFGHKNLLLAVVPSVLLIAVAYGAMALRYYYTQVHLFDPYLQVPPPSFSPERLEKPNGVFRILALGGSTTKNPLLPIEHRYPKVLQDLLREQYGSEDIEVFNGGMDWYTSKHSLINYVTNLRDSDPDLVVVMHAVNDLYRSFSPDGFAIGPYHRLWSHFLRSIDLRRPATFLRATHFIEGVLAFGHVGDVLSDPSGRTGFFPRQVRLPPRLRTQHEKPSPGPERRSSSDHRHDATFSFLEGNDAG